jgi:hypothetical protein
VFADLFWKPRAAGAPAIPAEPGPLPVSAVIATVALVLVLSAVGIWPSSFVAFSQLAGEQLVEPDVYLHAVLGGRR